MESKNPVFSRSRGGRQGGWGAQSPSPEYLQNMYDSPSYAPPARPAQRAMTLDDVVVKGFMTLGTLVVGAAAGWYFNLPIGAAIGAALVAMVLGLIASFKQSTNPALILGFAVFEGVALGVISHLYNTAYEGIVLQAILGTAFAFGGVLTVYSLRIVRVTPKFTRFVAAAGFAALGLMLVNFVVGFFVAGGIGIRTDSPMGWIFSVAMILVGCFFLMLDFDAVEQGVKQGAPANFAWQCAFGLTLSLVWIYLEVLRFISYFTGRD